MFAKSRSLWILNLDAEHELEAKKCYAPTRPLTAIVERARQGLWSSASPLVQPGDLVLADASSEASTLGPKRAAVPCLRIGADGEAQPVDRTRAELAAYTGRAWLPTTRARTVCTALDLTLERAPDIAVLKRVNARAFAALVRAPLAREAFDKVVVQDLEVALEVLAQPQPLGWLVRRPFGAAGRGRRRLFAGTAPSLGELDWLVASLRLGPLVIEPWVEITTEFTRSGHVTEAGEVIVSAPCFQATTAEGAWTFTESAGRGEVSPEDDLALAEALEVAGRALASSGYFGAFGIDAFRYRDAGGTERLNPLSEINARYTMDWALAMGHSSSKT